MDNIQMNVLESEENLKEAFNFFDEDKSWKISKQELKKVLGETENLDTLQKLLFDTDLDNDGEVF